MSGCSGCGTTPILFNKFQAAISTHVKPGPFDGVKSENRAFTAPINPTSVPEHLKPLQTTSPQMNGNGMFVKFIRKST
jgi:hypothetical protein